MSTPTQIVPLTTYYLEMLSREQLRPKRAGPDFQVVRAAIPCPELNRFFYTAVGWPWFWIDKLPWSYQQWHQHVDRPQLGTWIGSQSGTPAGYFELEQQNDGDVEIVYFGLLPPFTGKGLGGALLTAAIEAAWDWGTRRVWVHTCTLDHPSALANYLARGFRQFKEEHSEKVIPNTALRDWPR